MESWYPVFLRITGKRAVVLGGGPVAARKAARLASAGADVVVVSPELCPELAAMVDKGGVSHSKKSYEPKDIDGAALLVAATDEPAVNRDACERAESLGIPSNSVRPPEAGSFIVPSTLCRGELTLAISTGGTCPALSRRLRKELEGFIGEEYGPFLEFLEESRTALKERMPDEKARAKALTALVDSGLIERFRTQGKRSAREDGLKLLEGLVNSMNI